MKQRPAGAAAAARDESSDAHQFWIALARAFGGAIFFSLPLLMTMEMWWLGFYMDRLRLALFMLWMLPLLIALDHYAGFKQEQTTWSEDAIDGLIAYGVGIAASALVLFLFNVLDFETPLREWIGKVALQAVPASFGAVLATSQLGGGSGDSGAAAADSGRGEHAQRQEGGYWAELLFMLAGAVFLAFNVAPTEEMVLIAYKMTAWHALALAVVSLMMMHAFVYAVEFHGTPAEPPGTPGWSLFLRYTIAGYAIALLVSAYVLWTFGRYEAATLEVHVREAIVLGFPAALGASAARLIL